MQSINVSFIANSVFISHRVNVAQFSSVFSLQFRYPLNKSFTVNRHDQFLEVENHQLVGSKFFKTGGVYLSLKLVDFIPILGNNINLVMANGTFRN
jgi:hypothetical protein